MQPQSTTIKSQQNRLINEIHVSGRVATEPLQTGKGPTKFRLAHGGGGMRKNGTPWPVQFFTISCWDKKVMDGISRGQRVEVFGKLHHSTYTAKDGTSRESVDIAAEAILAEPAGAAQAPLTPDATAELLGSDEENK
jgi:single-stranded DNA-binding protein